MATIRTLDDNVSRTTLDLKRAQDEVTGKRTRITELEALLSGVKETYNTLNNRAGEQDKTLRSQKELIGELEDKCERLNSQVIELTGTNDELRCVIKSKDSSALKTSGDLTITEAKLVQTSETLTATEQRLAECRVGLNFGDFQLYIL